MASKTLDDRAAQLLKGTLGRSHSAQVAPVDRLNRRALQLDALLTVIAGSAHDDGDFRRFNKDIQNAMHDLAASLSTELNELLEQVLETNNGSTAH